MAVISRGVSTSCGRGRLSLIALSLALGSGLSGCSSQAGESTSTTAPRPASTTTGRVGSSTTEVTPTTSAALTTTTIVGDVIEVEVTDGEVLGGARTVQIALGSVVHIRVSSNTADHVHVHGYDVFLDVAAGSMAEIELMADIPGIFEVELEDAHLLLLELEVS